MEHTGKNIADFDALRLSVASSDDILNWSYGEVTKPETINYRTQKPERDGLFCERIFGPVKDLNPHDAKLKGVRARDAAIDKNGDLVTKSIVRRERMGHIKLAVPVAHIWFMRGVPSAISQLLGISVKNLERIAYYASYVILSVDEERRDQLLTDNENEFEAGKVAIKMRYEKAAGDKDANVKELATEQTHELDELTEKYEAKRDRLGVLVKGALVSEADYRNLEEDYSDLIEVGMGGEAIDQLLSEVDLEAEIAELTEDVAKRRGQSRVKIQKRLKLLEGMKNAGIKPESLCLTVLPVVPPGLRPMVQLTGGRFATSDMNDLYRRVIIRNNRLKKMIELNAPEVIRRNEKRMLQEAVDALIDNSSAHGKPVTSVGGRRTLKSLSDLLKGKKGRFRQNLLGKRVDYSGRSVIVAGPELSLDECGLPKRMALELFKPFIISKLIEWDEASNIRNATRLIESGEAVVWDALDEVIESKYVLLNRAPTLHRLGIQAFRPRLVEGQAIQLSPLVANGFNADFDGDQMAVHLPLSEIAQAEARDLMSARNNLLKPADGLPTLSIYQDIVLGSYYMTYAKPSEQVENPRVFASVDEAVLARDKGLIKPQTNIKIRYKGELRDTTLGRVKLNEALPEDFPFVNEVMTRKALNRVLARIFNRYGSDVTADTANAIKDLTLKNATRSAVSTGMTDYFDIDDLEIDLKEADDKVTATTNAFKDGLITDRERHTAIRTAWVNARNNISDKFTQKLVDTDTGISISVQSGARGSISNVVDVSGIVGVINATYNVSAKRNLDELKMAAEIELPVRSNYKKGLTPLELTVAARGSRKGLIDTALNTAKSGYLTRRLVDAAQDVFTVDGNEDTVDPGFAIYREDSEYTRVTFEDRLIGRYAAEDVKGHIKAGELITQDVAAAIQNDEAIASVKIMSPLSTLDVDGIPRKAYGIDLATGVLVEAHEPIGVIAAQSVGEPATQLTLNNKHGAGEEDVTEGLPRLEELLELYGADVKDGKLKVSASFYENKYALLSSIDGKVKVKEDKKTGKKTVTVEGIRSENGENKDAIETFTTSNRLAVKNGDKVARGSRITEGSIYPPYLMEIMGEHAAKRYILNDILRLYAGQGYALSSKHIEVIISQMFSRVEVVDPGDSDLSEGALVSRSTAKDANDKLAAEGKKLAEFKTVVQGIKRVSATSDSFLSAASFQDTTRVLIAAATSGKVDRLKGLKENVIIGRKIPVGTGAIAGIGLSNAPSEDEFTNL